jgi:hypothetical protein
MELIPIQPSHCYDSIISTEVFAMTVEQLRSLVKYVTNAQGQKTEVLVPVELWESLLNSFQALDSDSEFDLDLDSKEQILLDLKESLRQAQAGQTFSLTHLWDSVGV